MDANQIYTHLKDGQFREAFQAIWQAWDEVRWEARFVAIGMLVCLLLAWIYSAAGFLLSLLAAPLGVCALVAVARPTPAPKRVDGFVRWADDKRQRALAKGTFFAKWVMRPFYATLSGSARLTAAIKDPYLRAGVTITLQTYAVFLALFIVSAAIYAILVLLCMALVLWIIAYALSEGGGSRGGSTVASAFRRGFSGRSETRTDFWGDQYQQHHDANYDKAGYTEQRTDLWGDQYQQHFSQQGDKTGHSEGREDFLGDPYTQHYNQQGEKTGYSERKEDWLGGEYTQHYDQHGNRIGRSEERTDLFGDKYTKHEDE